MIDLFLNIAHAQKPYGMLTYTIDLLPMILCFLIMIISLIFIISVAVKKPIKICIDTTYSNFLATQSFFTMFIYGSLQYRWVVMQFESSKWIEILWAGAESLFLFTIFWTILLATVSIYKHK